VRTVPEFLAQLALAALTAILVALLDHPLFGVQLAWWLCGLIGLVVVFGGFLIVAVADE
jgi:Flp pilus assembly protein protease CpaA